ANWRRAAGESESREAVLAQGIRDTFEGSFWSMATTLLGFLSLLLASAKPLRDLGIAGAMGTVTAMLVAYTVYPAFLGRWARLRAPAPSSFLDRLATGSRRVVFAILAGVAALGLGALRLDTDPGLLTYFREGSVLREGLEQID